MLTLKGSSTFKARVFDRKRQPFLKFAVREMMKAFNKQKRALMAGVNIAQNVNQIIRETTDTIDVRFIEAAIIAIYTRVGVSFAEAAFEEMIALKQIFNPQTWIDNVLFYLESEGAERVEGINEETKKKTKAILEDAISKGLSVPDTAKLIEADFVNMTRARATRIARTEIVAASNRGAIIGAKSAGIPLNKKWNAFIDTRTRDSHVNANNQVVGIDEKFVVGDTLMDQPGDITAPAKEVIHCFTKDSLTYTKKADIKKMYKSWYNGLVYKFTLSNGKTFTCTPNHPILTDSGFVSAKKITDSTKLVKSSFAEAHLANFNINNIPSTFAQAFNSFSIKYMIMRNVTIDVNFYGDVPCGNVYIIDRDLPLGGTLESKIRQIVHYVGFKLTYFRKRFFFGYSVFNGLSYMKYPRFISHALISCFDNSLSFLFGGILEPKNISFASITGFDFMPIKKPIYCSPRTPEPIRKGENGTPIDIHLDNITLSDTVTPIRISKHNYNDFVYTMETNTQIYDNNSTIARNCRCAVSFIPIR